MSKLRLILALLLVCAGTTIFAQSLSIVVPAIYGSSSRDAHFNWRFESSGGGDVQIGQFACGSYWVAPAVGDDGVTLLSLNGNSQWTDYLSCDIDPVTERHGLLSGANDYGSYDASENILTSLPKTLSPALGSCQSLVAAMRRNEAATSNGGTKAIVGEVADAYCIVTVMPEAPVNGGVDMIRPNITGIQKEFLTWDDFDLNRLPTYDFIESNSATDWAKTQIRWRDATEVLSMGVVLPDGSGKKYSEGGRAFRPHILYKDYASGLASQFNEDVLALLSSDSLEAKKKALAAMLAFGNDIYHCRYNYGDNFPRQWGSGAGQHSGQFMPAALVAALSVDDAKANQMRKTAIYNHGADPHNRGPQELRQIKRGQTGVILWGDGHPFERVGNEITGDDYRYWSDMKGSWCFDTSVKECSPNVGKKTYADIYGYIDGPANKPGIFYMSVSTGTIQSFAAIMVLMPHIRSVVNTDAPIEYVDRVLRHGVWSAPDPVAAPSIEDQTNNCNTWYRTESCSDWGVLWGPNLNDPRFAILGEIGRYTSLHGTEVNISYTSDRARKNWATIMNLYDGETYEDNAVPLGVCVEPEILIETGDTPKAHVLSATLDSEVLYTVDGSEPNEFSPLYTEPISTLGIAQLRVRAFRSDLQASSVADYTFLPAAKQALQLNISIDGGGEVVLGAKGLLIGETYRIEYAKSLSVGVAWLLLSEFIASDSVMDFTQDVPRSGPHFFRIICDEFEVFSVTQNVYENQ